MFKVLKKSFILISLMALGFFSLLNIINVNARNTIYYDDYDEVKEDWNLQNSIGANIGRFRKVVTNDETNYYSYLKYDTNDIYRYKPRVPGPFVYEDLGWVSKTGATRHYISTKEYNHMTDVSYLEEGETYVWNQPSSDYTYLSLFVGNENPQHNIRETDLLYSYVAHDSEALKNDFPNLPYTVDYGGHSPNITVGKAEVKGGASINNFNNSFNNVSSLSIHATQLNHPNRVLYYLGEDYRDLVFGGTEPWYRKNVRQLSIEMNYYKLDFYVNNEVVYQVYTEGLENLDFKAVWSKEESSSSGDYVTLDKLPSTTGNLTNVSGDFGTGSNIEVDKVNNVVRFDVNYMGKVYKLQNLNLELSENQSLDFLDNVVEFKYYTNDKNERMAYIVNGEQSKFTLLSGEIKDLNEWRGQTIWNLTTGEISTINKAEIYSIYHANRHRNIEFYFYFPGLLVDNIIQLGFEFSYWQLNKDGSKGPYHTVTMTIDENTMVEVVNTDIIKAIRTSTTVISVTSFVVAGVSLFATIGTGGALAPVAATAISAVVGTGVLLGGRALERAAVDNKWFTYPISALDQNVTLTDDVKAKLRQEIYNKSGVIPNLDNNVYKLSLGNTFDLTNIMVPDKDAIGFTSLVFESFGKAYLLEEDFIDNTVIIPPVINPPLPQNPSDANNVWEVLKIIAIISIIGITLLIAMKLISVIVSLKR